jgi:hypothetical protein
MKSIKSYTKESRIEYQLNDAYLECWSRLTKAISSISN